VRVLVTGGAGFIGGHLVRRLTALKGCETAVLDNLHRGYSRGSLPSSVPFHKTDIRDAAALEDAMRGQDVVFHLAAQSNVMGAVTDAGYAFTTNVVGTYNVLQAAARAGVKRVVFTSSREAYGDPKTIPVPETAPMQPKNAYGASKVAGEVYCRLAAHQDLETVVLRFANVYGPGDRDRVIPLFMAAAAANAPLTIYGTQKLLDFVWIDTIVDALLKAGFGRYIRGPVNVGSGKGTTLAELARRVVHLTKSSSEVRVVAERAQEVGRFVADITRGKKLLGLTEPADPLWALPQLLQEKLREEK
jgi:UDP-glucose 4-epimerase